MLPRGWQAAQPALAIRGWAAVIRRRSGWWGGLQGLVTLPPKAAPLLCCLPLQDWNDGRIPYFTLPPKRDTEVAGSAQLVAEWGADFDAAEAATLAGLASMEAEGEAGGAFFQTDTLGAARVDFDGMAAADEGGSGSGSEEEDETGGLAGF